MEHSSHPKEMADAVAWLQQRVPRVSMDVSVFAHAHAAIHLHLLPSLAGGCHRVAAF